MPHEPSIGGRTLAALAATLLLALSPAPAALADDDSDLAIEHVGPVQTPQVLVFKVSNVGKENAPPTTATVKTIARGPANRQTIEIPRLPEGASLRFTYDLAAECDGTMVRAKVNLQKDEDRDNNTVEVMA